MEGNIGEGGIEEDPWGCSIDPGKGRSGDILESERYLDLNIYKSMFSP